MTHLTIINRALFFETVADKIIAVYRDSIAAHGRFNIALSGGNTPQKLYELLSQKKYAEQVNWTKVFVFWGDERCVAFDDADNNSHMAMLALLDHVPIPQGHIFRIPVLLEPAEAAAAYEISIKQHFMEMPPQFDLILLGLGEDGHTASLFPGTSILHETTSLVKEVFVEQKNVYRISFTYPLINYAANIMFLVTGKDKTQIIKSIFAGNKKLNYPAQLIKPVNGALFWYLDEEAAAQLKK
ncbi:MAG: 6-phosphogluconolactonase [Bacteroidetes bacterium]|nr:6-phosphogluconolactonase [Bacteroidota bacterium]